jgi:hypothetical protein
MAVITEVRFAHERGALAETLAELRGLEVTVIRETSTEPDQSRYFFRFESDDPGAIPGVLERDRTVSEVTPMQDFDGGKLWGVEFAPETKLLGPRVTAEGGFVVDARSATPEAGPRGWRERWLLPDRRAIHDIWSYARDEEFDFEVLELREGSGGRASHAAPNALTDEQRTTLRAAHEQGYFTEPRETSLEDLAETLDLSPSAVGGRLKRGMKSLIGTTLVVDRREE